MDSRHTALLLIVPFSHTSVWKLVLITEGTKYRPPAAKVEDRTQSRSGRGQADVERDDLQCWLFKRARLYMFSARARPMWGPMCD